MGLTTTTAGVYVRISDDRAEDAAGVGRQERDCRDLAERLGWHVGENVYVENDTSAYKRRTVRLPDGATGLRVVRPQFRRLLDDLAAGNVDALIAYDLDRVARDPRDLEDLIDVIERRKVLTRSVTGSLDLSNDAGVTMARVMVAVANKSSRDTARRTARKHEELAEQGKWGGGGIRSYGYQRDGMTVCQPEAEVIGEIAQAILAGKSLNAVAKDLTARGISTVRGGAAWHQRSVYTVVTKPRVAGLRVHRDEIVGSAAWPAILDRHTWERVRITLAGRAEGTTNVFRYWLTGVLRCSRCAGGLYAGQQRGGHRYWCSTEHGGCGGIAIHGQRTEAVVEELLLAYLARPDVLGALREGVSSAAADRARGEAQQDEEQLKELAALWAARTVSTSEYLTARKEIETRLQRWRAIVKASLPGTVRELMAGDAQDGWRVLLPAQRREVARAVFPDGIRVVPSRPGAGFDPTRLIPFGWDAA